MALSIELSVQAVLERLRDCLCAQLEDTPCGTPCRCLIVHGVQPAWDGCDCGLAWVRLVQIVPRVRRNDRVCPPGDIRVWADIELAVLRCAVVPEQGEQAPDPAEVEAKAMDLLGDLQAVYNVLGCCELPAATVGTAWTPLGPEGGCVGGRLQIRVPAWICPSCDESPAESPGDSPGDEPVLRGISVSGAEFAAEDHGPQSQLNNDGVTRFSNTSPGVVDDDYHYDSRASYVYSDGSSLEWLAGRGIETVRFPIRWERMQPTLNGALDPSAVTAVTSVLTEAASNGQRLILDVHNYGLYYAGTSGTRRSLGDADLTAAHFADLWARMAVQFAANPAVVGFGLMNEPQDSGGLTVAEWKVASQAAVTAIRGVSDVPLILVGGMRFSDMYQWQSLNGAAWITDPADRFRYEAHHYWSEGNDGGYTTYAAALDYAENERGYTAGANPDAMYTRVLDDLGRFRAWLVTYGAQGIVGEFGWPNDAGEDQGLWDALGERYLDQLDAYRMDAIMWSTGEFYAPDSDPLLVYQIAGEVAPPARLSVALPQAAVLEGHLVVP